MSFLRELLDRKTNVIIPILLDVNSNRPQPTRYVVNLVGQEGVKLVSDSGGGAVF